ncbi:fimbrial protein, partial [Burkholderia ubonensis]|uniref:fimbrial protein n=1 Tax=Burkholderia ubonensis TaxID=101571 RepID=UPI000752B8ED
MTSKMKPKMLMATAIGALLLSAQAYASDGTITFNGEITTQTCSIAGGGNQTVALPSVQQSALQNVGDVAGATAITIGLTGCTIGSDTVVAGFEVGQNVDPVTGRLKVTGGATNVQIGLYNTNDTPITIGDINTIEGEALTTDAVTLRYVAKYVATGGAAGSGT